MVNQLARAVNPMMFIHVHIFCKDVPQDLKEKLSQMDGKMTYCCSVLTVITCKHMGCILVLFATGDFLYNTLITMFLSNKI